MGYLLILLLFIINSLSLDYIKNIAKSNELIVIWAEKNEHTSISTTKFIEVFTKFSTKQHKFKFRETIFP